MFSTAGKLTERPGQRCSGLSFWPSQDQPVRQCEVKYAVKSSAHCCLSSAHGQKQRLPLHGTSADDAEKDYPQKGTEGTKPMRERFESVAASPPLRSLSDVTAVSDYFCGFRAFFWLITFSFCVICETKV